MPLIQIEILTSPSCGVCEEFMLFWGQIADDWKDVSLKEVSLLTQEGQTLAREFQVMSAPGIIINQELVASGGFKKSEIIRTLQSLSI